jgi:hypothetical protein
MNPRATQSTDAPAAGQKQAIDQLIAAFFRAFASQPGRKVDLAHLRELFIAQAIIIKNSAQGAEIYDLDTFIAPREKLLGGGLLVDFNEQELAERTEIFGAIAQRWSLYRKCGILSGQAFATLGMKTIQLVDTPSGWKISALAWDDERPGLSIPDTYATGLLTLARRVPGVPDIREPG